MKFGQGGIVLFFFIGEVEHGTPAGDFDDAATHGEGNTGRLQGDGGLFHDTFAREGFEDTGGNHLVDGTLIRRKVAGEILGNEQRMVVGDFGGVDAAGIERLTVQGSGVGCETGIGREQADALGDDFEDIVGNIATAGTGVGQIFLFIERLGYGKGFVR